jgi:hypothetical protein
MYPPDLDAFHEIYLDRSQRALAVATHRAATGHRAARRRTRPTHRPGALAAWLRRAARPLSEHGRIGQQHRPA